MEPEKNLSQTSKSPEPGPKTTNKLSCFFLTSQIWIRKFYMSVPTNLDICCVGFQVCLTSELLKLTHANASKDFYLAQHSANGVTGSFMHTNEFPKNWNPLNCELSSRHVITSNCYHPFIGCFIRRFFKNCMSFVIWVLSNSQKQCFTILLCIFCLIVIPSHRKNCSPMKLDPNSAEGLLAYVPSFHQQRPCLTYSLCLFNVQFLGIYDWSKECNTM